MAYKICSCCGHSKDESDFYKRGNNGYRSSCIDCYKKRKRKFASRPQSRYKEYKRSAKKRNLVFNLTLNQFKEFENKPCRYCGIITHSISLDRIDNDIGYVIDNIDSCCYRCNSLKHVFDEKEFLDHINNIYEFQVARILKNE